MDNEMPQYYRYLILFKGTTEKAKPVLHISKLTELKNINRGRMHLFDDTLVPILPAVEYCIHLPRIEFDTCDMEVEFLDHAHDVSHEIFIVPDEVFLSLPNVIHPALIIYADNCCDEAKRKALNNNVLLGAVPVSGLNNKLLTNHWKELYRHRLQVSEKMVPCIEKQYLLDKEQQIFLPALFTARQYNEVDMVLNEAYNTSDVYKTCTETIFRQRVRHNALMSCKDCDRENETALEQTYRESIKKAQRSTSFNIVIVMPGVSQRQRKLGDLSPELPNDEKTAIRLMGLHRAIAKDALFVELPLAGKDLYDKLNELEIGCIQEANNKYIHKTLRDIGKLLEKKLTQEQLLAIYRAKHITVFSDYPIGLAVMENTDSSLQCYKEISYRPLTPLTRSFQIEMNKHPQIYFGNKCKVAFAECIPNDKENRIIRACSSGIIKSLGEMGKENGKLVVAYKEVLTIKELKKFISDNSDADILHISAHGYYNRDVNMAGLMVGKEFWMADEDDFRVPPVVILSACHVSPRGCGCVDVADLFIRAGAEAVLGTFIPVNARRNTILLNRLYTYIAEAQKGSSQYKTIADAWAGIVATNAIFEIAQASKNFQQWIFGKGKSGKTRLKEFTMKKSVGKLHGPTMYADTISVIKDMLHEEGEDGKFHDIFEQKNFFPESFFYQWIGFPENIFLYNEVFEKATKMSII